MPGNHFEGAVAVDDFVAGDRLVGEVGRNGAGLESQQCALSVGVEDLEGDRRLALRLALGV
jgi:hypothetical protein